MGSVGMNIESKYLKHPNVPKSCGECDDCVVIEKLDAIACVWIYRNIPMLKIVEVLANSPKALPMFCPKRTMRKEVLDYMQVHAELKHYQELKNELQRECEILKNECRPAPVMEKQ